MKIFTVTEISHQGIGKDRRRRFHVTAPSGRRHLFFEGQHHALPLNVAEGDRVALECSGFLITKLSKVD